MRPYLFYAIAIVIVICDQVSKWAVMAKLTTGESVPVLGRYLFLTHTHNSGGAFSLLQARPEVFIIIAVVAIAALIWAYYRSTPRGDLIVSGAIALALGGAIGNLIDRWRFKFVVDFFDIQNGNGRNLWPIFNVADSAITVGIVLLAFHFLFRRESAPETEKAKNGEVVATGDELAGVDDVQSSPTPEHQNT